jgi:hypothetical protein
LSGNLADGGSWSFTPESGRLLAIDLKTTDVFNPYLTLADPDGNINRTNANSLLVYPEQADDYILVLPKFQESTANYTLSLTEIVDEPGHLDYDKPVSGELAATANRYWLFSGEPGQVAAITITTTTPEPQLMLYGPGGTPLGQQHRVNAYTTRLISRIDHWAPYVVVIGNTNNDETDTYTYTLTLAQSDSLPIPQACDMTDATADYGPIAEGSVVILGRHTPVNGEEIWDDEMAAYVGREAIVTNLAGVDGEGCPLVHVDIDSGSWYWRIRDMTLANQN